MTCLAPTRTLPWSLVLTLVFSQVMALSAGAQPLAGLNIMTERSLGNCVACHALPGQTGLVSTLGPSLDNVGQRHDEATLRAWVTDARVLNPQTLMPPFGTTAGTRAPNPSQPILTAAQIDLVVAALLTFR